MRITQNYCRDYEVVKFSLLSQLAVLLKSPSSRPAMGLSESQFHVSDGPSRRIMLSKLDAHENFRSLIKRFQNPSEIYSVTGFESEGSLRQ